MSASTGIPFREAIQQRSESNRTRLILALDLAPPPMPPVMSPRYPGASTLWESWLSQRSRLMDQACQLAQAVAPHVAAIKVGYPLILSSGLEVARRLRKSVPEVPLIADFKVADVSHTNAQIASQAFGAGFDALIVHGFTGSDAVNAVMEEARRRGGRVGVLLVVDMTNPGASQFLHPQARRLAEVAKRLGATGVIAPGTSPSQVSKIRSWIGPSLLILSPGIGAQGGQPGAAIAAGADYEIVGRAIYSDSNPAEAARRLAEATYTAASRTDITRPVALTWKDRVSEEVAMLLHAVGAIKFGKFTLSSGMTSPYYLDLRLLPSNPGILLRIADLLTQWVAINRVDFDRVAGVPTAGLTLATLLAQRMGSPLIYVRGKAKEHGLQRRVEGEFNQGDRVLVVDDLITTGESILAAVESLRAEGCKVTDVLVVVDREQGGPSNLQKHNLRLGALASISSIIRTLADRQILSKSQIRQILEYLSRQK